ncbi:MAG: hypothetical protein L3K11_06655, partial [Thermoplasmata archaeon]|nr:hypothetical protein [Thermoplasmata archaeon]
APALPVTSASGTMRSLATPVQVTSFSFQPSSLSVGTQASASVSLSGGNQPYYLWFNNTPPGCGPSAIPEMLNTPMFQYSCHPSATGNFQVHLDVLDSSAPRSHATQNASVMVNSNSGNGNNNNNSGSSGGKGNGSLSLPSGLQQLALIFGAVFLVAMLIIAAGTMATAVVVSRRLRQINETLAKVNALSKDAKPPT